MCFRVDFLTAIATVVAKRERFGVQWYGMRVLKTRPTPAHCCIMAQNDKKNAKRIKGIVLTSWPATRYGSCINGSLKLPARNWAQHVELAELERRACRSDGASRAAAAWPDEVDHRLGIRAASVASPPAECRRGGSRGQPGKASWPAAIDPAWPAIPRARGFDTRPYIAAAELFFSEREPIIERKTAAQLPQPPPRNGCVFGQRWWTASIYVTCISIYSRCLLPRGFSLVNRQSRQPSTTKRIMRSVLSVCPCRGVRDVK